MTLPRFDTLLDRDATYDRSGYGPDHLCVRTVVRRADASTNGAKPTDKVAADAA